MIFVNFKTYKQGTGEAGLELAKICQAVSQETSVKISPVVQASDVFRISQAKISVWSQHVDMIEFGPNTGQVLGEAVLAAGAQGTILNHSENKLPVEVVVETVKRCQGIGLKTLVCSDSVEEAQEISVAKPDLIAYEPAELIGGDISVSQAKPEVIKGFVAKIKTVPVLVGAGIHNQADVKTALGLGVVGILVSSDVVLAQDQKKELLDLAKGFKS